MNGNRCGLHDLPLGSCADCRLRAQSGAILEAPVFTDKGPWVVAVFDGACSGCGEDIGAGSDEIRADGYGGWEGRCCGDKDDALRASRDSTVRAQVPSGALAEFWEQAAEGELGYWP